MQQNVADNKEEIIRRSIFTDKSPLKNSKRQQLLTVMDHNSYSVSISNSIYFKFNRQFQSNLPNLFTLQEESSEDSAYNEGEGVLSSDSRGSTPQNLSNKHQSAKLTVTDNNQPKIINASMTYVIFINNY